MTRFLSVYTLGTQLFSLNKCKYMKRLKSSEASVASPMSGSNVCDMYVEEVLFV